MTSWFGWLTGNRTSKKNEDGVTELGDGKPFAVRTVTGADASAAVIRFRKENGFIPVLFGDQEEYDRVQECASLNEGDFDECIRVGESIDVAEWLAERVAADPEYYDDGVSDDDDNGETSPLGGSLDAPSFLSSADILTGKPKAKVFIGMLPVQQPWHVPAMLRMGGWNECPAPEEHVAMFRHWYERYGAVVACVTDDVVEFTVARPPSTIEEARILAREQYIYCADIVQQGVGSEAALARGLLGGSQWYFWWD